MNAHPTELIPLAKLVPSKLNVRKHGDKAVASLAASIAHVGLLQPLVVRPTDDGDHEVLAGGRRHKALLHLHTAASETLVPCVVLAPGHDAIAIEASLAENVERAAMDELDQYTAIAAMIKAGSTVEDAASSFNLSVATINKRLALARLAPGIQTLYRAGGIRAETIKLMTLAPRARQAEYLKLHKAGSAPPHWQLRTWLLGRQPINTTAAIFPIADYTGPTTTDLFAEETLFADTDQFWLLQNKAIAAIRDTHSASGWRTVAVLDPSERFCEYDYEPATKAAGAHVIIEVEADGTVTIHKGLLPRKLVTTAHGRAAACDTTGADPNHTDEPSNDRPELTEPLAAYVDTVRLLAVRADLIKNPKVALRLLLAHLVCGSTNIKATPQLLPQLPQGVVETIANLKPSARTDAARIATKDTLKLDPDAALFRVGYEPQTTADAFAALLAADDKQVLAVAASIMADTIAIGSSIVDAAGAYLGTDVRPEWTPGQHLLDLIHDKEVTNLILDEIIGTTAAAGYTASTGRAKRDIVAKALAGEGREKVAGWQPKWTRFPAEAYTTRRRTSRGSAAS